MQIRASLRTKMLISLLLTAIIIFSASTLVIHYQNNKTALINAEKQIDVFTKKYALSIEQQIIEDNSKISTLAVSTGSFRHLSEQQWKEPFISTYYEIFENSNFYELWDSWEPQEFDTVWSSNGAYSVNIYRKNNITYHNAGDVNESNDKYELLKNATRNTISEPYLYKSSNNEGAPKLVASIVTPINNADNTVGAILADIAVSKLFTDIIDFQELYNSTPIITSNSGTILYHSDSTKIGLNIINALPGIEQQFGISEKITKGVDGFYKGIINEEDVYLNVAPIKTINNSPSWSIAVITKKSYILQKANSNLWILILVFSIGICLLAIVIIAFAQYLKNNIDKTSNILEQLSVGDLSDVDSFSLNTGDALETMSLSVNTLISGLNKTSHFAKEIGDGNLESEFTPLSKNDILGNSLLYMRKNLKNANKEAKERRIIDERQKWANNGLAKFSDILHGYTDNINKLSYQIMSNLVNYMNANQGALFIVEEDENEKKFLNLKSAIAYGKEKHMNSRIEIGEYLVGRCAFEMKTIYMTDVPNDYVNITSGLGTANPSTILLIPLQLNDEIFGVIEIASFEEIEQHQIEFVEKLGETIASTINNVYINEKTAKLLKQSRIQTEEMTSQEEEMRQNLEELQATQEDAMRREHELEAMIKTLGDSAFIVEYDLEGKITYANEKYSTLLNISPELIIGQSHSDGFNFTEQQKAEYGNFWNDLINGNSKKEKNKISINNKELWLDETYTPIFGKDNAKPYKILKVAIDITTQVDYEELLEKYNNIKNIVNIESNNVTKDDKPKSAIVKKETTTVAPKVVEPTAKKPNEGIVEAAKTTSTNAISTDSEIIQWQESYLLDIPELDEQHKQLVELANLLHSSVNNGKTKKEIKDNLRNLNDFASYHFGNEEGYFEEFKYENAESHIREHKSFIDILTKFQKKLSTKGKDYSEFMELIRDWMHIHLTEFESEYKDLFKSKGM